MEVAQLIRKCLFFILVFLSSQLSALEIDMKECIEQLISEETEVDCSLKYRDPQFSNQSSGFVSSLSCQISLKFDKGGLIITLLQTSKIEFQEKQVIACQLNFGKAGSLPLRISLKPYAVVIKESGAKYFQTTEIDLGIQEISGIDTPFQNEFKEKAKDSKILKMFSDELNNFLKNLDL
jgi:hypothetical protein